MPLAADSRFTLERGGWYGLTMFPGYSDCPYHSPIGIDALAPRGARQFEVRFLNLRYAAGVQNFTKRLQTLRSAKSHLVAAETEVADHTYVIARLNRAWLGRHEPHLDLDRCFAPDGKLVEDGLFGSRPPSAAKRTD